MRAVVPLQHAALRFAPLEAKYLQKVTLAMNGVTASTCNRKIMQLFALRDRGVNYRRTSMLSFIAAATTAGQPASSFASIRSSQASEPSLLAMVSRQCATDLWSPLRACGISVNPQKDSWFRLGCAVVIAGLTMPGRASSGRDRTARPPAAVAL